MNLWECEAPGCESRAVGVGGAIGLRAIGWYFEAGPKLLCPVHRHDPSMKRNTSFGCNAEDPCSTCKAEEEADKLQFQIVKHLEITGNTRAYAEQQAEKWGA